MDASNGYAVAAQHAPAAVMPGQRVAEPDAEEVVLFLIGMRVNRWRRLRSWLPVFVAMPRMLRELQGDPGSGLLHARTYWSGRVFLVAQYWHDAETLGRYARDSQRLHAPAWARWNRSRVPGSGDVGIFHETYIVPREGIETRYANVPPVGLGAAFGTLPRNQRRRRTHADGRVEGVPRGQVS